MPLFHPSTPHLAFILKRREIFLLSFCHLTEMGTVLSKEQEVHFRLLQQLLRGAGCQVKDQHLINLLQKVKCYCPWFPDRGSSELPVWEKVKWHQEHGADAGSRRLLTWSLVCTTLCPLHTRQPRVKGLQATEEENEE